jgi:hypothetical protein
MECVAYTESFALVTSRSSRKEKGFKLVNYLLNGSLLQVFRSQCLFSLEKTTYPKSLHYVFNLRDALRQVFRCLIIIQCRWRSMFCKYLIRCNKCCGLSFFQLDVSHYPIRARVSQNGIESGTTRTSFSALGYTELWGLILPVARIVIFSSS